MPALLVCTVHSKVSAQAVYQSSATNTGNAASATVNKPAGVSVNDLLVVGVIYEKGSAESISPPAGWTLIRRSDHSTDAGLSTYYKVAGATEPASYAFAFSAGSKWCIGIARISNVNTSSPIDVSAGSSGSGSSVSAPSVTTSGSARLVLCFYTNKKDASYTPAGTTSERYDNPNTSEGQPSNMMASFLQASSGATGNRTATASETEKWASQQVAISPGTVLPVELLDFGAEICEEKNVCLDWVTATEVNNDYFQIERSVDGVNFSSIAKVKGAGTSMVTRFYSTKDVEPPQAIIYYRLKQVDFNGSFTYSNTVAVDLTSIRILSLYPNPANGNVNIQLGSAITTSGTVKIYDLTGRVVMSRAVVVPWGESTMELDVSNLSKGGYHFTIQTRDQTLLQKQFLVD